MKIKTLASAILLIATAHSAFAASGVVLGATRVVYEAANKEASLTVSNRNKDQYFLVQSWVEDKDGSKKVPFSITPPLFRLNAQKDNMLRVITTGNNLPTDRESVYWVNVKAIPPAPAGDESQNVLQLAIKTRIKMFYRPAGLPGRVEDAPASLQWSHKGDELIVKNPSAYSVTLDTVKVSGKEIQKVDLVLPKSEAHYKIPEGTNSLSNVTYSAITDFGGETTPITSIIN